MSGIQHVHRQTGNAGQNDGILDEIDGCLARVPLCRDQRERFIALFDGASPLASRRSFPVHVTASALILSPSRDDILLLKHRRFGLWLQPGGHLEPGETPLQAMYREILEETGIQRSQLVLLNPWAVDFNVHKIDANAARDEPAHWHADLCYALAADSLQVTLNEESRAFAWVPARDPAVVSNVRLSGILAGIRYP
ncbi:NUDIX hydrolase [Salmonella enterica]|nr:NUDIX hydrolase [Salmonella enterica]